MSAARPYIVRAHPFIPDDVPEATYRSVGSTEARLDKLAEVIADLFHLHQQPVAENDDDEPPPLLAA